MKLTSNFQLQELVNPYSYNKIGNRSADFLHPSLALTIQTIRDELDEPITINDWLWGGQYKNSGLRLPKGNVGASMSAHRFGCAADLKFDIPTDTVLSHILNNTEFYTSITRIESINHTRSMYGKLGRDWLHIEVGIRHGAIDIFNP